MEFDKQPALPRVGGPSRRGNYPQSSAEALGLGPAGPWSWGSGENQVSVAVCFRDLKEQEFSHRVGVIPTRGLLKEKAKAGHTGL